MIDNRNKLLVFITIDAWGLSLNIENNAIRKANIPDFKDLIFNYPATAISMPGLKRSVNYQLIGRGRESDSVNNSSISRSISQADLKQIKIASSEDIALLSVFLNNSEERFLNEDYLIVDEDKNRFFPFLNKNTLVNKTTKYIKSGQYQFIAASLPYIDSALLQGSFSDIVLAVEKVSRYLGKIAKIVLDNKGVLIVSSVHGGAEDAFNIGTGVANKKRTNSLVPFLIVGDEYRGKTIGLKEAPNNDLSLLSPQGSYLNIAPSILKILGLEIPPEMTAKSFV
jgi:2,3-bisphosphoglycerate-independent phosphoglycerate mutase